MVEAKKHLENIIPYPVDEEFDWELKLDFNENLFGPSPKVINAIKNIKPHNIRFYPTYKNLVETIAEYNNVPAENILPVNGTDEGYRYIFDAYCSFGDNVLNVTPTFSMPKIYSQIANCNYKEIPYQIKWEFPLEEFLENITTATKLVIVTSPNSPTGELIKDEDLKKIIEKAQNSLVIIDETYAYFANKTYVDYPQKYENVAVIKSMSKDFATAGLRLGYIIASSDVINNIKKIASPYNVNSIAALAGITALSDVKYVEKIKKEIEKSKKYLINELKPFAKEIYPTEANFICIDFGNKAEYIYKKLLNNKIKVKLLSGIAQNCFRITIPPLAGAKKLIKVLKKQSNLIVFDMDGVLVDASKSYRVAIQKTFEFFTNKEVSLSKIQDIKNLGGYNNDWLLTQKLLQDENINIKYEKIVEKFNEFYFGNNYDGLVQNEKWLISKEELENLAKKYDLAIFTGRQRIEADIALEKAGVKDLFYPIITMDDLSDGEQKPSPRGLEMIRNIINPKKIFYLGDTRDDIKAGISANAVTIGILPPQDKSSELKEALKSEGATTILNSAKDLIKYLEK